MVNQILIKIKEIWFSFDLNPQIQVKKFLVWTSNSFPRVELVTKCKYKSLVKVLFKFEDSKKKFYQISIQIQA
jgi:hypothetical protein